MLNSLTSVLGFLFIVIGHKYETLGCSVIGGKLAVQWTEQGMWNGNGNLFIRIGSHDENNAKAITSTGSSFGEWHFPKSTVFPIVLLGDTFSLLHG